MWPFFKDLYDAKFCQLERNDRKFNPTELFNSVIGKISDSVIDTVGTEKKKDREGEWRKKYRYNTVDWERYI